ncbi:hypothetical protein [Holdemanella sp.]|uniref:hypothetical protein n=1 Tax=Holdemanella sp. TaxID=1971762 RepID=UPI00307C35AB
MWIRSQCGKILMDCDFFAIEEHVVKYAVIILSGKSGISVNLGTYTTKYKALSVLNDIQEWYECSYGETFQMPQDEDDF